MLKGYDISEWQYEKDLDKVLKDGAFCWLKASEGKSYRDKKCGLFTAKLRDYVQLGYYHFARPDRGNTAEEEARNFCEAVKTYAGSEPVLLALDWEGKSLDTKTTWITKWMAEVEKEFRGKPLIYVSETAIPKVKVVLDNNHGLWVASWNKEPGSIDVGRLWAFHQYATKPLDASVFNGTITQLESYTCVARKMEDTGISMHCGCCCYKKGFEDGKNSVR